MSLTSRVQRLITGPTPSVGSDDWPSRYIWRWIWRRSVVATSVAARAMTCRRQTETISDQDQEQIRPDRQQGRQRPRLFRSVGRTADQPDQRPGADAMDRVGARVVVGDQREDPRVVDRAGIRASSPDGAASPTRAAGRPGSAGNRASPREAIRATNRPRTPSSATIRSDWMTPRIRRDHRIALGAQELTSATIRDRPACMRSPEFGAKL